MALLFILILRPREQLQVVASWFAVCQAALQAVQLMFSQACSDPDH